MSMTETKPDVKTLALRVSDRKLKTSQRMDSIGDLMHALAPQMMAALPKHLSVDRMIKVSLNCLRKTPDLLDCTPQSLIAAVTEAATYGWELGGVLGHGYLVPYGDECKLIPGYKGLIDLCRRSGQVSTISMEEVYDCDKFSYRLGDDPKIEHVPNDSDIDRDKRPITYVYAVVVLRDGGIQRSVWSTAKINAHRDKYSEAYKNAERYRLKCEANKWEINPKKLSMWHTAWVVAGKKTVIGDMIHRGLVPMSSEHRDMMDRAEPEEQPLGSSDYQIDLIPPPRIETGENVTVAPELTDEPEHGIEADQRRQSVKTNADPTLDLPTVMLTRCIAELRACQVIGQLTLIRDRYFGPDSTIEFSQEQDQEATRVMNERAAALREKRQAAGKQRDLLVKGNEAPA